ncbi:Hsp20/alpha crystallin family protein [Dehalococcoides mccartyi]|nr:Hsp20/alpha crystallin family protein [Dehalococcoides mccartyi]
MNRLWRGFGGAPAGTEDWNISLDVVQRPDELVVKASIPGVKPETIDLAIEDNILTLRADRKPDFEDEKSVYLVQERPTGSFYRALRLPETVDGNKVQSTYENGVLTIVLPKAEEKKKKQIKIQIGSGSKAIETKK